MDNASPILPPTYDEVVVAGEYTDKDGQEVLVDSDLFHPSVRAALSRTDEDFFPDSKFVFIILCSCIIIPW